MLLPKRVKYRRVHRGRLTGKAYRGNKVTYGDFGLQALEPAWIILIRFHTLRTVSELCQKIHDTHLFCFCYGHVCFFSLVCTKPV